MEEIKDNSKRPSKSRRRRQQEKKLTIATEDSGESDIDGMIQTSASQDEGVAQPQADQPIASTSAESEVQESHTAKTKKEAVTSGNTGLAESVEDLTAPGPSVPKKKKRRKKASKDPRYLNEELFPPHTVLRDVAHLQDDVVEADDFVPSTAASVWHTNTYAQPTGKLFVESGGAFKAMDSQKLMQVSNASLLSSYVTRDAPSAVEYGLSLYSAIKSVALYCHGLLAGFALWLCVTVYCLGPPHFALYDFVAHYSTMAAAVQAMFYMMTAICIVSLMGSMNVGGDDSIVLQLRPISSGLVALVIYFVTLLLSLSIADQDDKLSLFGHNSSLSEGDEQWKNISTWRNVNLCRCLGVILAWLILAWCPHQDLLKNYLHTFTKNVTTS